PGRDWRGRLVRLDGGERRVVPPHDGVLSGARVGRRLRAGSRGGRRGQEKHCQPHGTALPPRRGRRPTVRVMSFIPLRQTLPAPRNATPRLRRRVRQPVRVVQTLRGRRPDSGEVIMMFGTLVARTVPYRGPPSPPIDLLFSILPDPRSSPRKRPR